jgi:hypothetical protein
MRWRNGGNGGRTVSKYATSARDSKPACRTPGMLIALDVVNGKELIEEKRHA